MSWGVPGCYFIAYIKERTEYGRAASVLARPFYAGAGGHEQILPFAIDLGTVNGYGTRGCNADLHLVAANRDDGNANVVADYDFLIELARQNEHGRLR